MKLIIKIPSHHGWSYGWSLFLPFELVLLNLDSRVDWVDKVIRLDVIHHLDFNIYYPYKALNTLNNTILLYKVILFLKASTFMKHARNKELCVEVLSFIFNFKSWDLQRYSWWISISVQDYDALVSRLYELSLCPSSMITPENKVLYPIRGLNLRCLQGPGKLGFSLQWGAASWL